MVVKNNLKKNLIFNIFFILLFLCDSNNKNNNLVLATSNDRIQFNFSINSNIYNNQKTIITTNNELVYYLNQTFVSYGSLGELLNGANNNNNNNGPEVSLTNISSFQYTKSEIKNVLLVAISNRNNSEIFITNDVHFYQVIPTQSYSYQRTLPMSTINRPCSAICNQYYFSTYGSKSELGWYNYTLPDTTSFSSMPGLPTNIYMLLSDNINSLLFGSSDKVLFLFSAGYVNSIIKSINDQSIRFTGSLDINNKQVYFCSKLNGYSSLSFEVYKYSKTSLDLIQLVNFTDTTLTSCEYSTIDLVQGQVFFSALDSLSNKFIVSMDLNGLQQQSINLNWSSSVNINGLSLFKSNNNINKLLVPSNIGTPLMVYNYKSICENDCSGNGYCISMVCKCYQGYGLSDCSQAYPIVMNSTGLPTKRPGYITISGDNFKDGTTTVTISGYTCNNLIYIDKTLIKCYFQYDLIELIGNPIDKYYPVNVTVGKLSTTTKCFNYLIQTFNNNILQQNDTLLITGNNIMDIQYQNTIRLNELNLTPYCFDSTINQIQCKLPDYSINGDLVIVDYYKNQFTQPIKLNPIILSIDPVSIPTTSTELLINGLFFNCEQSKTINIINGELSNGQVGLINSSTLIIYNTPNRIVKTNTIQLQTSYSISNSIQYKYQDPTINSIVQPSDNNGILRLIGNNLLNPLDISYLMISYNSSGSSGSSIISLLPSVIQCNFDFIDLKLPSDFVSTTLKITINGKSLIKFINIKPIISSILPLPSTSGSDVTIIGNYLSLPIYMNNNNNKLTQCTFYNGNKIVCTIPNGSGIFNINSQSIDPNNSSSIMTSSNYSMNYIEPTITSIVPQGFFNAISSVTITITGNNFISNKSLVNVFILSGTNGNTDVIPCSIDSSTTTQIICNFQSNNLIWSSRIPVIVSINSISNSTDQFFYHYLHCPGSPYECSNNGQCDYITGLCKCKIGYQLKSDCSIYDPTNSGSTTSATTTNGGSISTTTSTTTTTTTTTSHNTNTGSNTTNQPSTSASASTTSQSTGDGNPSSTSPTQTSNTGASNPTTSSSSPTSTSSDSIDYPSSSNIIKNSNFLIFIIISFLFF